MMWRGPKARDTKSSIAEKEELTFAVSARKSQSNKVKEVSVKDRSRGARPVAHLAAHTFFPPVDPRPFIVGRVGPSEPAKIGTSRANASEAKSMKRMGKEWFW
jgi:hypothetical protein